MVDLNSMYYDSMMYYDSFTMTDTWVDLSTIFEVIPRCALRLGQNWGIKPQN